MRPSWFATLDALGISRAGWYPASHPVPFTWDGEKKVLSVEMTAENSARIFRLKR